MGLNIPTQATGAHDKQVDQGNDDQPKFVEPITALPGGDSGSMQPTMSRQMQCRLIMRITSLLTMRADDPDTPQKVLEIAKSVFRCSNADVDVLARTHLAVGRVHRNSDGDLAQQLARVHLHQAWLYSTMLHGALYDPLLIVEAGTQLALAMHTANAGAQAENLMARLGTLLADHVIDEPSLRRDVDHTYRDAAREIGL